LIDEGLVVVFVVVDAGLTLTSPDTGDIEDICVTDDNGVGTVDVFVVVVVVVVVVVAVPARMHVQLKGCIVLNEHNTYSIRPKPSAIYNRCFPGPTRVVDANGISIASAVFAGLTR